MAEFLSKEIGRIGEDIACKYLKKKGHRILERNYVPKWKTFNREEIDIICEKDKTIIFVEVKTLRQDSGKPFLPEDKINFAKQQKIIKVAESYLLEKKIPLDRKWQIDAISITIDPILKKAKIRHLKNAVG